MVGWHCRRMWVPCVFEEGCRDRASGVSLEWCVAWRCKDVLLQLKWC